MSARRTSSPSKRETPDLGGRGGSASLIDGVKTGDTLLASLPRNDFELKPSPAGYTFIAGGIGITPLLSMTRHLKATGAGKFRLYYLTRSKEATPFLAELMGPKYRGLVTIHHDEGDPDKAFDLWPALEKPKGHIYCCGPRGLMTAVRDMTGHWSSTAVHFEAFQGRRQAGGQRRAVQGHGQGASHAGRRASRLQHSGCSAGKRLHGAVVVRERHVRLVQDEADRRRCRAPRPRSVRSGQGPATSWSAYRAPAPATSRSSSRHDGFPAPVEDRRRGARARVRDHAAGFRRPARPDHGWRPDPRPEARARFETDFSAVAFATVDEMCAKADLDVVYVATPHQFHRDNVASAARHGRHVLVEKPMALTLEDCRAMIDVTRAAGVVMIVGHSHSFDAPIARTRSLIAGGSVGELKMITASYFTDFLFRPRRAEELDTSRGGGVIFNQAPHQVDVVRLLGGGRVKSVRANVGAWDRARGTEGAYQALLTFDSGVTASLTYSGYAHFDGDEQVDWIAESGLPKDPARYGVTRRALAATGSLADEEATKAHLNYGGAGYSGSPNAAASSAAAVRSHQHFGHVIASCERADLRPTAKGVHIHADAERSFEALPPPRLYRDEVIGELHDAIVAGRPAIHTGEWNMATMEVCLAMLRSAREQREIELHHQVALGGAQ